MDNLSHKFLEAIEKGEGNKLWFELKNEGLDQDAMKDAIKVLWDEKLIKSIKNSNSKKYTSDEAFNNHFSKGGNMGYVPYLDDLMVNK